MRQPLKSDPTSLAQLAPLQAALVVVPRSALVTGRDGPARCRRARSGLAAISAFRAEPPAPRGRVAGGGMVPGAPEEEPVVPPRPDAPGVPLPEVPVETPPEVPVEVPDESEPDFEEPVYPDTPPEIEPMTPPEIPAGVLSAGKPAGRAGVSGNPR